MAIVGNRWSFLALACLAVVMSLSTWFSATAVLPDLIVRWSLSASAAAWLTNGVQAGFVTGALAASVLGLVDRWPIHRLIAGAACLAALANLSLLAASGGGEAIAARFVTGVALAGVYPPAIKLMATWFHKGRGLALGLLIGALTLGSAAPHLIRAFGTGLDWRLVVLVSSACCGVSAVIFAFALGEGPYPFARSPIEVGQVGAILRDRSVMLANVGYFGHMWELYAMWGWFLAFATAARDGGQAVFGGNASLFTFVVVAAGVPGCIIGGLISDRIGRCATTILAMALSGLCALAIGFAVDGPSWLLVSIAVLWGTSVIADSAQFSTAVTELCDARLVGSALALQMGVGFAITLVSTWAVPLVAAGFGGWQWAFALLAPGPLIGAAAMLILRRHPDALKMAHGRR